MSTAHTFALFSSRLPAQIFPGTSISFIDHDNWLRITQVLRLTTGEKIIVFNEKLNAQLSLEAGTFTNKKHIITGIVTSINEQKPLAPAIHVVVGLTKREAFEDILYCSAQMGITSITPLLTKRIHRNWITEKDALRLKKIMIAGCEQGKQFVLPTLKQPHQLTDVLSEISHNAFVCSPEGMPLLPILQKIDLEKPQEITLLFGPEGGFDQKETELITAAGITPLALCKSILRSQDAVQVIVGSLRSII
ncbi:16S rRNA (uracil(1498)-N(3))-methyltransferase [Candidatus Dependentiae bacterium]|nr:16S rRNA (uracil(1498)-N(3))-methyltransferase [Candidatus Dependentiae bacterium]